MKNRYSQIWFDTFLNTIPPEQTRAEIDFLTYHLPLPDYEQVLDVCCGSGRHALPLAAEGYRVTGVDASDAALAQALDHPNCVYLKQDMRALSNLPWAYDALICLWQSFGYFDAPTNADILRQMSRLLRPAGRLVLDIYNRDFFEARQGTHESKRKGVPILTQQLIRENRLTVRIEYGNSPAEDVFEWQVYTEAEIDALAASVGLRRVFICAGFDRAIPPAANIPRMQAVFEKITPAAGPDNPETSPLGPAAS
jgi:SAM-dependent methyltransferase